MVFEAVSTIDTVFYISIETSASLDSPLSVYVANMLSLYLDYFYCKTTFLEALI